EDAADLICDGLVEIASFHQYRVDGGDRAAFSRPATLEQAGQKGECAWRIAAPGRWLTGGQADFPRGASEACDAVHQEQYALATISKILGNRGRHPGRTHAHERRRVARSTHHHAAGESLFSQAILDEFTDFSTAL